MKKSQKNYLVLVLAAAITLYVARYAGALGGMISLLAYAVPVFVGALLAERERRRREEECGSALPRDKSLSLGWRRLLLTLPLIAPTVLLLLGISYLTGLVLAPLGLGAPEPPSGSLALMLAVNCLVPALFEEMLFRYLPMRLRHGWSFSFTLAVPAVLFAFMHGSLYAIPYALAAGVIFMLADLAFESVIPSMLLHFVNNATSALIVCFTRDGRSAATIIAVVGILAAVSLAVIAVRGKEYKKLLRKACSRTTDGNDEN